MLAQNQIRINVQEFLAVCWRSSCADPDSITHQIRKRLAQTDNLSVFTTHLQALWSSFPWAVVNKTVFMSSRISQINTWKKEAQCGLLNPRTWLPPKEIPELGTS